MKDNLILSQLLESELETRKNTKFSLLMLCIIYTIFIITNLSLEENSNLEFFYFFSDFVLFVVFVMYDTNKINSNYNKIINDNFNLNENSNEILNLKEKTISKDNSDNNPYFYRKEQIFNTNNSYCNVETTHTKTNNIKVVVSYNSEPEDYSVKTSKRRNYIELDDGDGGSYGAYVDDAEYAYHQDTH